MRIFHFRDLRRIRNTIGVNDYCNSPLLNLPSNQTNLLQLGFNSAARAVTKPAKFHCITFVNKSPNWLNINEKIQYLVFSSQLYKILSWVSSIRPAYLHSLLTLYPTRSTWPSLATLNRRSNPSYLQITKISCYRTSYSYCLVLQPVHVPTVISVHQYALYCNRLPRECCQFYITPTISWHSFTKK